MEKEAKRFSEAGKWHSLLIPYYWSTLNSNRLFYPRKHIHASGARGGGWVGEFIGCVSLVRTERGSRLSWIRIRSLRYITMQKNQSTCFNKRGKPLINDLKSDFPRFRRNRNKFFSFEEELLMFFNLQLIVGWKYLIATHRACSERAIVLLLEINESSSLFLKISKSKRQWWNFLGICIKYVNGSNKVCVH